MLASLSDLRLLSLVCAVGTVGNAPPISYPPVPIDEYPVYNQVIDAKFLTSQTTLVLIDKLTVTGLEPDGPPPSRTYFEQNRFFDGKLDSSLVTDFLLKTTAPSRLEPRFNFGVSYRLVSGEDPEQPEVAAALPVQFAPPPSAPHTVGRLLLSRVAFSQRREKALVYAAEDRPDGTGGGLLIFLQRRGQEWSILDTEVLWTARPDAPPGEEGQ
jgi:hypothetical protein